MHAANLAILQSDIQTTSRAHTHTHLVSDIGGTEHPRTVTFARACSADHHCFCCCRIDRAAGRNRYCVGIWAFIRVCVCAYTYILIHIYIYVYMYVYTYIHIYLHICMHNSPKNVDIFQNHHHTHTHTHKQTHKQTHTHTHTPVVGCNIASSMLRSQCLFLVVVVDPCLFQPLGVLCVFKCHALSLSHVRCCLSLS
jgi:hypothetical protein